jgi:hypothetical protein
MRCSPPLDVGYVYPPNSEMTSAAVYERMDVEPAYPPSGLGDGNYCPYGPGELSGSSRLG